MKEIIDDIQRSRPAKLNILIIPKPTKIAPVSVL